MREGKAGDGGDAYLRWLFSRCSTQELTSSCGPARTRTPGLSPRVEAPSTEAFRWKVDGSSIVPGVLRESGT